MQSKVQLERQTILRCPNGKTPPGLNVPHCTHKTAATDFVILGGAMTAFWLNILWSIGTQL